MTTSGSPTPGWYPDPHNPAQLRYWDGMTWTESVTPADGGAEPFQDPAGQGPALYQGQAVYQGANAGPAHGLGDLGSWVSSSFSVLVDRIVPVAVFTLGLPLVGWLVVTLLAWLSFSGVAFDTRSDEFVGFRVGYLVAAIVALLVTFVISAMAWLANDHQLYRAHAGQPESLGQSLSFAFRRLPRALVWGIAFGLMQVLLISLFAVPVAALIAAGGDAVFGLIFVIPVLILLAIPLSVYLWIKLAFVWTAISVGPSGINPFSASWRLSGGRFWPMLGRRLLLWGMVAGISSIGSIFSQIGIVALPFGIDIENDAVTGELVIDGEPLDRVAVIEFDWFLPNLGVALFFAAMSIVLTMAPYALQGSGITALYWRAGGPSDFDH